MTPPIPSFRPQFPPETPAIVRTVSQQDVQWDRPLFRAPPLLVSPPPPSAVDFPSDIPGRAFFQE